MENFQQIYKQLRAVLKPYEASLHIEYDTEQGYSLNTAYSEKWKKEVFFGAAVIKKNYVSFHLMPVYMYPDLLDGISPALKAQMQGKSCFNFKQVDAALFDELAQLTKRSIERARQDGLV